MEKEEDVNIAIDLGKNKKQQKFAEAYFSGKYKFMMYGGAIRGGKTFLVLTLIIILCRAYPRSRWAIVRKDLPTIRRNVLPSFFKVREYMNNQFVGDINYTTWIATCDNGSQIIFFPENYQQDKDLNRWKGLEVNGFGLEEANELQEKSFNKAIERAGAWVIPPDPETGDEAMQPDPIIFLTCNPALGWVKTLFYNRWKNGTLEAPFYYLPAQQTDNPFVTDAQRESWSYLPEPEYRRFVLGDWDVSDDPNQLIKAEWFEAAYENPAEKGMQSLGIDVARYGNDKTTFAFWEGNVLVEFIEIDNYDIHTISTLANIEIQKRQINADRVGVDVVGLGAGVADNLKADGLRVKDITSGAKPIRIPKGEILGGKNTSYSFKNLRSQMWWYFREMLRLGKIRIDVRNQSLVDDCLAIHYKMSGDREIKVESKDDIHKRIGRSTDYGDSAVYGLFARFVRKGFVASGSILSTRQ